MKAGQLLAEMDPVDLDQRVGALDASIARAARRLIGTPLPKLTIRKTLKRSAYSTWMPYFLFSSLATS